ncbi:DNA polymerase III subunit alpha [bacterium]|nr:MAG: DNA polymerase III subunit alpha [bacterium]
MPRSDFIHLHVHTQYSLLDGACTLKKLTSLASRLQMPSLAITDHGNLFGAIEFYQEAQSAGIKPIIGCEAYIAPKSRFDKTASSIQEASYHFILLCKDEEGYHNLMRLVSLAYLEGFYYRPRIDKESLAKYSKGLIGLSACLKGEVPCLLQNNQYNLALKCADDFSQILGKGNFYLELQENRIPEQATANQGLLKIAKELSLPIVATNDVHYLSRETAPAHEALLCIQTQSTLSDPQHMRFQTDEFYFKTQEEMKALFKDLPQAIANTVEIAERCNLELDFKKLHLPHYQPQEEGLSRDEFLRKLCREGLKRRFPQGVGPEIEERLEHELSIIKKIGFTSYFLIVWDFIHFAKSKGIPVGPGRGSAAGSLVSYLLAITDINPLKYGLLFERFLNPDRVGLPDIDIDFCYERRQEVIDYVTQKYGRQNVAQIITFGTMLARAVIRDVGRVMGIAYADVDKIAKLVPAELNITLEDALAQEPELKNLYDSDPAVAQLIDTAKSLEGLTRHASTHAAGVVISDQPLEQYLPLFKSSEDQITTGYSMEALEKIGLLKIDFLGLRTLTVIERAGEIIALRHAMKMDIEAITLDDPKAFQLLSSAQTMGVFQLESNGMRDLLRKIKPDRFEDLIAILALYRPGPMGSGMLEDFIQRRANNTAIHYESKKMEPILKATYGIMVYQEQVMQIASSLAGFSLAQADILRKAMAKKIPEVIERQRKSFVEGCKKNAIREQAADKIFDQIEFFSGYGFNKSHSAAYAMISYRTAYLKANYPVEFMAALLTSEKDNTDKIVEYVAECQRMGIEVLPADINESRDIFTVVDGNKIRFGLIAVKNVGRGAIESILKVRDQRRNFKSLEDFCEHLDLRLVNRKVIESLIKAGAMDCLGQYRAQLMVNLEHALEASSRAQKEKLTGQLSFFDLGPDNGFKKIINGASQQVREWPEPQLLAFEKEMLGFYITGHPLARFASQLKRFTSCSIAHLGTNKDGDMIKLAGLIVKIKHTVTRKSGEKMAILKLEDLSGAVELLVFPEAFKQSSRHIQPNSVVLVQGRLNLKEEAPKIVINSIIPLEEAYKQVSKIDINIAGLKENLLSSLKQALSEHTGPTPVYLHMDSPNRARLQILVSNDLHVQPNQNLIHDIETLLGEERFSLTL